jgi:signal peptidase I
VSANRPPDETWPPPAEDLGSNGPDSADGPNLDDTAFTSPSLGAYDRPNGDGPAAAGGGSDRPMVASIGGSPFEHRDDDGEDDYFSEFENDFDDFDTDQLEEANDARRNAIEWAVVLVGAVLLALILRAVLLQAFWIPSPSMESTLLVRDRVLVNKMSYRLHDIHRGDVIVFRRTEAEIEANPELPRDVIKRVIALEGETIEIVDDVVTIDGNRLIEPYLDEGVVTSDFGPTVVPEGHVFVMGDNRELSLDSRFETGPISHDRVVGRAFFLFWPLGRMGAL